MEAAIILLSIIFMVLIIYHLVNYYNLKKINNCEILYKIKRDIEEKEEEEYEEEEGSLDENENIHFSQFFMFN